MTTSPAVTATSYVGLLAIVGMWFDGAMETGRWHVTYEVMAAWATLTVHLGHNLSPLWRAILKKVFGYDPYANGEVK